MTNNKIPKNIPIKPEHKIVDDPDFQPSGFHTSGVVTIELSASTSIVELTNDFFVQPDARRR